MYFDQNAVDLINMYYYVIPNGETPADAFDRAKRNAMTELEQMKIQDFKRIKGME
jgi:hypothetical protein